MSRIVLGVAGGIAAYKACSLLRHFTETGHDVTVVPTQAALASLDRFLVNQMQRYNIPIASGMVAGESLTKALLAMLATAIGLMAAK